jgi:lysozyme family protein
MNGDEMFAHAWSKTGNLEKGYVNNPNDPGGETNMGITVAVARAHGYTGEMKDLPPQTAMEIAKESYWDSLMLDAIGALSPTIAEELFDVGFLAGTGIAAIFLQRGLNLFNRPDLPPAQRPYPDIVEDAHIGRMTVYAFGLYLKARGNEGEVVMQRCLMAQHGCHFMEITRASNRDGEFVYGWFFNRVAI